MIQENEILIVAAPATPSPAKILIATVAVMVVAAILLVVAILPAEYGIDPIGTGKALGLSDLAKASAKAEPTAAPEATISPVVRPPAESSKWGTPGPHVTGTFIAQPQRYKIDSREIVLAPNEGMEIKYNMKKGAGLIFSWTASKPIPYEFHGVPNVKPEGKPRDYFESYDLSDKTPKDQFHATFIAPSAGIHGWFWENTNAEPVTLKLVSAGFYNWIQESRHDKQRAIDPMDPQ